MSTPKRLDLTRFIPARLINGNLINGHLTKAAIQAIVLGVVAVVVAVVAYAHFVLGGPTKQVSASFTSAVGIYPGTPVDIMGIQVGRVTSVHPEGGTVRIEMQYDRGDKVPANPIAVIVANSLVADRYIELAPAYSGSGPVLADHASIPANRTAAPAELDDIYGALNKLSVALGPTGANKDGALSNLVNVGAANLSGNGAALAQSITALSQAARTLADGSSDLFGTVQNLQKLTQALADSDSQVRTFENQLAEVSGELADERTDLGAALHNLTQALSAISGFVKDNAGKIQTDVSGLADITSVLTKEQGSLNETLAVAPVALSNLVHAYDQTSGTIDERTNLDSLTNPSQVCGLLNGLLVDNNVSGGLLGGLVGNLLGPTTSQIVQACTAVANGIKSSGGTGLPDLSGVLGDVLGGLTLPQIPGAGG